MITWIGDFSDAGAAYPLINRNMTAALERAGVTVLRNQHNIGTDLTPLALACTYPPMLPNVKHATNAVWFTWEFNTFPRSFLQTLEQVDRVLVMSEWVAQHLRPVISRPVDVVPLGFDPLVYHPDVEPACWADYFPGEQWAVDPNNDIVLWVGGTDKRHGLDIAVDVIDALPNNVHLVAKVSTHYPQPKEQHSRVHFLRAELDSLAPLYRAAALYLQTARAVGFSLPALEAMACGCHVVSTRLEPVLEYAHLTTFMSPGGHWQPMEHHIHRDMRGAEWWEPDRTELARYVERVLEEPPVNRRYLEIWRSAWTWDSAAEKLIKVLEL